MLEIIENLPQQLIDAKGFEISVERRPFKRVIVAGMGGSAISGDVVRDILDGVDFSIEVVRNYSIPSYATPEDTLFISISYSGNTEETLSAFHQAQDRNLKTAVITSNGTLEQEATRRGLPVIKIPSGYPPRGSLGWLVGALLKALEGYGLIENANELLESTSRFLREIEQELKGEDSISFDIANKFYRRLPIVYVPEDMKSVAMRWQAQINENAKQLIHTHTLPEMNHNEINGILHPQEIISRSWVVFLKSAYTHERISKRIEITKNLIEDEVMGLDVLEAKGRNRIESIFYSIWLGDFVSYYLALFNREDPIEIPRIGYLKEALKD